MLLTSIWTVVSHTRETCKTSCKTSTLHRSISTGSGGPEIMLNGEKNNYLFNAGVALAIGLIASSLIFGWFYSRNKRSEEAITVTGSAKKRITSDLVVWSAGVSAESGKIR